MKEWMSDLGFWVEYKFRLIFMHIGWFLERRRFGGWDSRDTYELDVTIARFVVPRLKLFIQLNNRYPNCIDEVTWNEYLGEILFALEMVAARDNPDQSVDWVRVKNGLELFGRHFTDLWW